MKKCILMTVLALSGCIGVDIQDDFIGSNLSITNTVDTLYLGQEHTFTYRYTNSIGEIQDITPDWNVSDEETVSIDANGQLTLLSEGDVWVSVSYLDDQGLVSDTTSFFISKALASIIVTNSVNELRIANTYQLEADYYNVLGELEEVTLVWESSDPSILTIDQEGNMEAIGVGEVNIIIHDEANNATETISITVLPAASEEEIRIQNAVDELEEGVTYTVLYQYYDETGEALTTDVVWTSSDESILTVSDTGVLTPISTGSVTVTVHKEGDTAIADSFEITVFSDEEFLSRSGVITTTSSYLLEGDFSFTNIDGGIRIDVSSDYQASTALPQLVVYITNNPNTINPEVSLEVASVSVFEGAHSYEVLAEGLDINTYDYILYYCKPFAIKVGDGKLND